VSVVVWHDLECGAYSADLPIWHELAAGGTVLDVGAGTGRVALRLARSGCTVTALDRDPILLSVLSDRAVEAGVEVRTVVADAADFDAGEAFDLVAVPMQTIQLLPERAGFFACARRAVKPGGLVALAITAELEPFEGTQLPEPDVAESGGKRFVSQPTAVRLVEGGTQIERLRHVIPPGTTEHNLILLAAVTAEQIAAEGEAAGLTCEEVLTIPPTFDHVGSEVVVLRG
jgi:SAM-dependent methyltransferase